VTGRLVVAAYLLVALLVVANLAGCISYGSAI